VLPCSNLSGAHVSVDALSRLVAQLLPTGSDRRKPEQHVAERLSHRVGARAHTWAAGAQVAFQFGYTTLFGWFATWLLLRSGHLVRGLPAPKRATDQLNPISPTQSRRALVFWTCPGVRCLGPLRTNSGGNFCSPRLRVATQAARG